MNPPDLNLTKGKIMQQYASLTEYDVVLDEGTEDEINGRLQMKLGKIKQEINYMLENAKQMTL